MSPEMKKVVMPLAARSVRSMPPQLRHLIGKWRNRRAALRSNGRAAASIFSEVYRTAGWGQAEDGFCSGPGSRAPETVEPYVAAVRTWVAGFAVPPSVLDLGCGDFTVGARLRDLCGDYVACDVVPELIQRNLRLYGQGSVAFRVLDIAADLLPEAEIIFLRQVLQHLSNRDIEAVLGQLGGRDGWLVLTEPEVARFRTVNADIVTGAGTRWLLDSHVDITAPPFSLKVQESRILCEAVEPVSGSRLVTTLYRL